MRPEPFGWALANPGFEIVINFAHRGVDIALHVIGFGDTNGGIEYLLEVGGIWPVIAANDAGGHQWNIQFARQLHNR